jgi:hypothetical protein
MLCLKLSGLSRDEIQAPSGAAFSLWVLVIASRDSLLTNYHRLKPAPLVSSPSTRATTLLLGSINTCYIVTNHDIVPAQRAEMMRMSAYVLMANHVHILWTPMIPLEKITHQIKGATTHQANLILSRAGNRFWQDESFDHWIRNPGE